VAVEVAARVGGRVQDENSSPFSAAKPAVAATLPECDPGRAGRCAARRLSSAQARALELRAQIGRHDYRYYVLDDPEVRILSMTAAH